MIATNYLAGVLTIDVIFSPLDELETHEAYAIAVEQCHNRCA